jgi:hypothetical protein
VTVPIGRLDEVVIDCLDPLALAPFWQALIGGDIVRQSAEWVALVPPSGVTVSFQQVPEVKTIKNRVHLDIDVESLEDATAAAEALGATRVGIVVVDSQGGFQVMLDPAGNEFCFINGETVIDPS